MILKTSVKIKTAVTQNVSTLDESVSFIDQSPLVVANHGSYTEGEGEGGVNYPLQTIIKWKLSYRCTSHLHCVCIHGMLNRLVIEHGITYH